MTAAEWQHWVQLRVASHGRRLRGLIRACGTRSCPTPPEVMGCWPALGRHGAINATSRRNWLLRAHVCGGGESSLLQTRIRFAMPLLLLLLLL